MRSIMNIKVPKATREMTDQVKELEQLEKTINMQVMWLEAIDKVDKVAKPVYNSLYRKEERKVEE